VLLKSGHGGFWWWIRQPQHDGGESGFVWRLMAVALGHGVVAWMLCATLQNEAEAFIFYSLLSFSLADYNTSQTKCFLFLKKRGSGIQHGPKPNI